MTLQNTAKKSANVETLRAKKAALSDAIDDTNMDDLARAAADAADAAVQRGEAFLGDAADMASRNLRAAQSGIRDFSRNNPKLSIAAAAIVGFGLAAWLRSGQQRRDN